jgi:hypothetical protein
LAFEVTSSWSTFRPLHSILRSVNGVASIKRQWFNDDRVRFTFHGEPFVVNEPWGDNSRYWIGPENPEASKLDIAPIQLAFQQYRGIFQRALSAMAANARDS